MTNPQHQVSAAAHQQLPHANPLSAEQMAEPAHWAVRHAPANAIDIGCGPGSFSVALASLSPVRVRALDPNAAFLQRANASAQEATLLGSIDFLERPLLEDEGQRFDLVVCIGSSGAMGSPREALQRCKQLLAEGGTLVFAELVWSMPPSDEFLSFLGIDSAYYWQPSQAQQVFAQCGLSIEHQCAASASSWADYERAVLEGRLKPANSLPPEAAEQLRQRANTWYQAYQQHGRLHFDFNAYVARHGETEPTR